MLALGAQKEALVSSTISTCCAMGVLRRASMPVNIGAIACPNGVANTCMQTRGQLTPLIS